MRVAALRALGQGARRRPVWFSGNDQSGLRVAMCAALTKPCTERGSASSDAFPALCGASGGAVLRRLGFGWESIRAAQPTHPPRVEWH